MTDTTARPAAAPCAAVILSGGQSTRMGRDKATVMIDGASLLERTVRAALAAGADPVVVVGGRPPAHIGWPADLAEAVVWTREQPPFGGPVAALAAGLAAVQDTPVSAPPDDDGGPWTLVLPVDLAEPEAAIAALQEAHRGLYEQSQGRTEPLEGIVGEDAHGYRQHLTGLFRLPAVRRALTESGADRTEPGGRSPSAAAVMDRVRLHVIPAQTGTPEQWTDLDVPEDLPADSREAEVPGLRDWLAAVAGELRVDDAALVPTPVLSLSTTVARQVMRPGVPPTSFLVGVAVGRAMTEADAAGQPLDEDEVSRMVRRLSARVELLAAGYAAEHGTVAERGKDRR